MTQNFSIPEDILPVYIPTNPALQVRELKMVDVKRIGERKTIGSFMVRHDNPKRTIEFNITYSKDWSFNAKGIYLVNFMNEMMKEGGCDYGIIVPKILTLEEDLEIFEVDREAVKITKLTESSKEFEDFVSSTKFSSEEKKNNFQNSVTAFSIFSYMFGGVVHDSGNILTSNLLYNFI